MQDEELSSRIHYRREGLQIFFVLSGNILFLLQCVQITTQHNKSPLPLVHRDVCTRMQSCGTGTTKSTNLFKCYLSNITRLKSHEDEDIFPMLFFSSSSNSLLYTGISIQTPWQMCTAPSWKLDRCHWSSPRSPAAIHLPSTLSPSSTKQSSPSLCSNIHVLPIYLKINHCKIQPSICVAPLGLLEAVVSSA